MRQPRSIRFHFALIFLFFFLLVVLLGLFSISRLDNFNRVSADVAERWLPTTRVLGDLNNFTSDFRAIEGSNLLSSEMSEIRRTETEMADLDRSIADAERNYERLSHGPAEFDLYVQFKDRWNEYRKSVNQLLALSRAERKADAITLYMTNSRSAYNAASDKLGQLTDRAVADAQEASLRLAATYRHAYWLIGLAILIAAVMVAAALLYFSRFISAPLLHLAHRMHRLAVNDTSVDIPGTERGDEIGEMARAAVVFRNNAIELMRSQQVLAEQAAMLEEQLAQEQRLALLQRNFVTMASHEFRTPLNIIDGHAQRLVKTKERVSTEEIGERARKIRAAVLRLTHLIDNLLNSSRLFDDRAEHYFHPAEIEITALLHEVVQLHREISPGATIVENFGTAPLAATGDPKLLSQVFSNLLSNAVKYSPDGGTIEIAAACEAGEINVAVIDQGIGIPPQDLPRLFDRYHRGSNVSGIVGTGVGLYLVKMVLDLHGGTIRVESREGEGSRFEVRLPVGVAPHPKALSGPGREAVLPAQS